MNVSTHNGVPISAAANSGFLEKRIESSDSGILSNSSQHITVHDPAAHAPQRGIIKAFCDKAYAFFLGIPQVALRIYHRVTGWANEEVLDARGDRIKHLSEGNDEVAGLLRLKINALKAGSRKLADCYGKAAEVSAEKTKNSIEYREAIIADNLFCANVLGSSNQFCDQQLGALQQQAEAYQKEAEAIESYDDNSAEIYQQKANVYQQQADAYYNAKKAFELEDNASFQIYQKQADAYQKEAEAIESNNNKLAETYAKISEVYKKAVLTIAEKNQYINSEKANKEEDEPLAKFLSNSIGICDQKIELFQVEAIVLENNGREVASAYEGAKDCFEMQLFFLNKAAKALTANDQGKAGIYEQLALDARDASKAYLKQFNALEERDNNLAAYFLAEASSKVSTIRKSINSIELQAQRKEKVLLELKQAAKFQELLKIYGEYDNLEVDETHVLQKEAEAAVQRDLSLKEIELLHASQQKELEKRKVFLADAKNLTTLADEIKAAADLQRQGGAGASSSRSNVRVITAGESKERGLASNQNQLADNCLRQINLYEEKIQILEKSVQELEQKIEDYSKLATAYVKLREIHAKVASIQEIIGGEPSQATLAAYDGAIKAYTEVVNERKKYIQNKYEEEPSDGALWLADYSYGDEDRVFEDLEKKAEAFGKTPETVLVDTVFQYKLLLKERDQLQKEIDSGSLSEGVKKQKIQILEDTEDEIGFYEEMLDLLSKQLEAFKSNDHKRAGELGESVRLLEKDFNDSLHSWNKRILRPNSGPAQPQKRAATVAAISQRARVPIGPDSDDEEEEENISQSSSMNDNKIKSGSIQELESPSTVTGLDSPTTPLVASLEKTPIIVES
ncbi:MAG: hypothetical protein ACOYK6_03990 [Chthoniobacterales bacterium]